MTGTDSARLQPTIDTTLESDRCIRCGGTIRPVAGRYNLRQCMGCGAIPVRRAPLVIAGDDLVAVIRVMAPYWRELGQIENSHYFMIEDAPDASSGFSSEDPTWAELYEADVAELASKIGEIRVGGDT